MRTEDEAKALLSEALVKVKALGTPEATLLFNYFSEMDDIVVVQDGIEELIGICLALQNAAYTGERI